MIMQIKNLTTKAIIGVNDWERKKKQKVIINLELEFSGDRASETDNLEDTINYRSLTDKIIDEVEKSSFLLIEKLANHVLKIVMENTLVKKAVVEISKPGALEFADSVSITCEARR